LALLPVALLAQQPATSTASPPQSDIPASQTTIKTEVRQVLLDVVVSDGQNHPVTGLHQQDFSVFEDGKPQQVVFFQAHSAASAVSKFNAVSLPVLPPNTFLNAPTGYEELPLNILLYDVLNTPVDDQPLAHREVVKFLQGKPAGSRFAIFVLSEKLQLLQGFTDDERQLVAAMNRKEAGAYASGRYQTPEQVHETSAQLSESDLLPNNPGAQGLLDRMEHMESVSGNYYLTQRIETTVSAFAEIARFVNGLPGRKNLIWLSGSFPASILPGSDPTNPFGTSLTYSAELRQMADLFTVGQIAVYPVDIRGLMVNPVYGAGNPHVYRSSGSFGDAHARFGQQLAAEHDTMDKIAEDSGGHAFYDTNGLQKAIATGTDDGANYYTLGYTPTNKTFDGGLRKIRVSLGHKGYHLAYRRSYLADDNTALAEKTTGAPSDPVEVAMRRGAPPAHTLVFEAHVMLEGAPEPVTPAQINQLSQFPAFASQKKWDAVKMQGYTVDFAVLGRQLTFAAAASGAHSGKFEFVFAAYSADGHTMIGQRLQTEEAFSPKDFDEVRSRAYRVRQQLDIPNDAAYLRLAVRDVIGNRLGSMEIPLPLAPEAQSEPKRPPQ
jgi:VWFA-related protein